MSTQTNSPTSVERRTSTKCTQSYKTTRWPENWLYIIVSLTHSIDLFFLLLSLSALIPMWVYWIIGLAWRHKHHYILVLDVCWCIGKPLPYIHSFKYNLASDVKEEQEAFLFVCLTLPIATARGEAFFFPLLRTNKHLIENSLRYSGWVKTRPFCSLHACVYVYVNALV